MNRMILTCHYIIAYSTASWELPQSVSNVLGPWILRIGRAVTCQTEHFKENVWLKFVDVE